MNETIRSGAMLRWLLPVLGTIAMTPSAFGADLPAYVRHGAPPPQVYGGVVVPPPRVVVDDAPLISAPSTPLLPGSSTLPGNYGRPFDYYYQGPYYGGGPYPSYFFRLPYACGVYGYCEY